MCGIAGALGVPDAVAVTARMTRALAHRGPDDHGVDPITMDGRQVVGALGHRRLSIIDLSPAGHQPMWDRGRQRAIVFNGEIYNFRVLRDALSREGVAFRTESDTEVILEGYARHGSAFFERMRGMFAFVIWDAPRRRALLVRDQFGIKPLYTASVPGGGLLFASELRALVASGLVQRELEPAAITSFLAWGAVAEPLTALRGVSSQAPGTVVQIGVSETRVGQATQSASSLPLSPEPAELERDARRAARLVRDALQASVAHHLVADVPIALFLSGGIDSSAVVALAAAATTRPVETFTVTFAERSHSEATVAEAVARRFGTVHREVPLSGDDFLNALPGAFSAMDQPSLDGLNTFVVSGAVRAAGFRVVLSGLGGDELFAGYPSFRRARALKRLRHTPRVLRQLAASALGASTRAGKMAALLTGGDPARAAYVASRALFAGRDPERLLLAPVAAGREVASAPPGLTVAQSVSWYEMTGYMRNTLLRDSDVFSMAHHLELRVPFVDREVCAASLAVDDSVKFARGVNKPLLVNAVADLLPREVWDRPKQGFELPVAHWLRGVLRSEVESLLLSPARLERVGLRSAAVAGVWEGFLSGRAGMSWSRPWALYSLVRWAETMDVSVADDAPGESAGPPRRSASG